VNQLCARYRDNSGDRAFRLGARGESVRALIDPTARLKALAEYLAEIIIGTELTAHLGYNKHDVLGNNTGNSRNGFRSKVISCEDFDLELKVPRDRLGSFKPLLIPAGSQRIPGFDRRLLSCYALGLPATRVRDHLEYLFGADAPSQVVDLCHDAVIGEIRRWQTRPLESCYPLIAIQTWSTPASWRFILSNRSPVLVLGVDIEGRRQLLGIWLPQRNEAEFGTNILRDLKSRGLRDVFALIHSGFKSFPGSAHRLFPHARVQALSDLSSDLKADYEKHSDAANEADESIDPGRIAV
jgi:putative transposase